MEEQARRTRIVATLGPASNSPGMIRRLIDAGVDVFRLNFSHGTHETHGAAVTNIRAAAKDAGRNIAILMDLQGPKIRIGELEGHCPVELVAGARLRIVTEPIIGNAERVSTTYTPLPQDIRPGDPVLLDDGRIQLRALSARAGEVLCEVVVGGPLAEHKGMNLPHTPLSAPCLTERDIEDLRFGLGRGVDFVALSFVRQASDVKNLRREMHAAGRQAPVIAKIERVEAIENLGEIVDEADGIMVARGDLAVETSAAEVPILQKRMLAMAGRHGKPDITATQMLETMVANPQPSRAEATDVANAVFDGTDALMLSAETAVGRYPVEAVRMMAEIALRAEEHLGEFRRVPTPETAHSRRGVSVAESAVHAACASAAEIGAKAIAVFTLSGRTAFLIASHRPAVPVVAFTPHEETCRRLALAWGVRCVQVEMANQPSELAAMAEHCLRKGGLTREGDLVVILAGSAVVPGATNVMKIHRIGERAE